MSRKFRPLQSQPAEKIFEAVEYGKAVFARLEKLNSIAAIHGISLGGFTELGLACRYRVATDAKATLIGVPEVQLGFLPGWGGTVRLPRLIGLHQAFPLISTGKNVDAKKAWRLGMIDEVVNRENLVKRAEEILLSGKPRRAKISLKERALRMFFEGVGRGLFVSGAKKAVYAATRGKMPAPGAALKVCVKAVTGSAADAYMAESLAFAELATTQVSRNLVSIFFGQTESKKMPHGAKPAVEVKTVGVLGAGVMGAGIAQSAAYKGFTVVLKDIDQGALDKGMANIRGLFDELVKRRKLTQAESDELFGNITATLVYSDMSECDMVIEAVAEIMKVKKIVRGELDKVIQKPYVFASNTSSLSIGEMAEPLGDDIAAAKYPELVVGLHFFNPVHLMPLVEVVRGSTTSSAALACAQKFALKLGKTTVKTNDAPGFVVNRILAPYMREAIVMAQDGVPMEDIEKAAKNFGIKMGPFALLDEVGLDIAGHVINTLEGALGDRMSPPPILNDLKELELLGKKGGRGFFLYDASGKRVSVMEGKAFRKKKRYVFNPDVLAAIAKRSGKNKKTEEEIQDRLFFAMVAEAARCIEENVVEDPSQLDIAMIFGTGFPPHVGGVLRWADSMGTKLVCQKLAWYSQVAGANYEPCDLLKEKALGNESFIGA